MKTTRRLAYLSGLVVAVCGLCIVLNEVSETETPAVLAAEGGASISDVMVVAHAGKGSLIDDLKVAFKGTAPASDKQWKAVKARGAILATLAADVLAKRSPPEGEASSWKKEVSSYAETARKLVAAASEKDADASGAAVSTLARSCRGCHRAHRG